MLILSRFKDQSIMIGDSIRVMVVGVYGERVQLGIDAPREVSVHREEIALKISKDRDRKGKELQK